MQEYESTYSLAKDVKSTTTTRPCIHYQMTNFLFWKCPLYHGGDTAVQATALAAHLCVKAISQTWTDIHPLISPSEVFHSQSWISVPEAGGQITFKMKVLKSSGRTLTKREWLSGHWPLCSGSLRLSRDTPVTSSGRNTDEWYFHY